MIKFPIYNYQGEKTGIIELPENIFNIEINNDLIYQVVNVQKANSRDNLAHAKDRSEVRGGGKKPWRQKGTGRARHGSIRSPLWRGGGITFGPSKNRVFDRRINKKAKRKALLMVLSSKVQDKELVVLDELKINEPKTKTMSQILNNNKIKNVLIAVSGKNENIVLAGRNIPKTKIILANSLNVLDLLSYKYLLIDKQGIEIIEKTYGTV